MNKKQISKRNRFFTWTWQGCLLLSAAGFLMTSCAGDGFTDESFVPGNGVTNTQLVSPSADDITITPSADGSKQEIAWPLVYGAGGYQAILTNQTTDEVMVDSIIDGLSFIVNREEDTNYQLDLKVLGNEKLGNTAGEMVSKAFTTFSKSNGIIPNGTDLYEYFQTNPVPDPAEGAETDEFIYDLVSDGEYTISQPLDFNYHKVTLRTADKANHATITLATDANFVASNDLTLKYVDIDASATSQPVITLYKYDTDPDGILEKPKNYYLINYIRLMDCNIKGVNGSLVYDNNKSYCVMTFMLKNCVIQMNTTTANIKNESWISFQGGGVKDFSASNTTVYQTGEGQPKYFIRYNNSVRVDRITGSTADYTTMNYTNCTFYKVNSGQWANYSGISNYTTYTISKNIWVDCGDGATARRIMGNGRLGNNATATWSYNTYWLNGAQCDQGDYDNGGSVLTTDPAFENAENGDFTPTGADQVTNRTGDLRWFE